MILKTKFIELKLIVEVGNLYEQDAQLKRRLIGKYD